MKPIENRGRTWEGVTSPRNFAPFATISNQQAFEQAWTKNPAAICAHMSHAAYHEKSVLIELFQAFGAEIKFYNSKANKKGLVMGRQAFMAIWPDKAILAFRGTEIDEQIDIEINKNNKLLRWLRRKYPKLFKIPFISADIIDDLHAIPIAFNKADSPAKVHKGFYQATDELWPQIIEDIKQIKSTYKPIYVTGHSLGGAMAIIAAAKEDFTQAFTFGMPAAGTHLDKIIPTGCQHSRYVNGKDPVTKVVPKLLFKHHGEQINIEDIDGTNMLYDHSIINYAVILTPVDNYSLPPLKRAY